MEITDYKKLAENVEVISAVLKKTSCDIAEIANMFIWLGSILLLKLVTSTIFLYQVTPGTADNHKQPMIINNMIEIVFFLAQIIVFLFCFVRCYRRQNKNSIYLMQMWGIILFFIQPFLQFLSYCITNYYVAHMDTVLDLLMKNNSYIPSSITSFGFYWSLYPSCVFMFFLLLGIFVVGTFAHNRRIKFAALLLILIQAVLTFFLVLKFSQDLLTISVLFGNFCATLGLLLCGILLKMDKRRILNGIE